MHPLAAPATSSKRIACMMQGHANKTQTGRHMSNIWDFSNCIAGKIQAYSAYSSHMAGWYLVYSRHTTTIHQAHISRAALLPAGTLCAYTRHHMYYAYAKVRPGQPPATPAAIGRHIGSLRQLQINKTLMASTYQSYSNYTKMFWNIVIKSQACDQQ